MKFKTGCVVGIKVWLGAFLVTRALAEIPLDLVHHWNFDEGPDWHDAPFGAVCTNLVAIDCVGGATATLQNMGSSNWVSGRQYTALEFDGVNQHLTLATNLAGILGGTSSLSFWLRTIQSGAESNAKSPGIAGVNGVGGIQWGWLDEAGRIGLSVENSLVVRSSKIINDGRWHHVVLTRDSNSGTGQVYLDGSLSASAAGPSGLKTLPFSSLARIENGSSSSYFQGRLDQVYVFRRVITGDEVLMLHTNHAPKVWDATTEGVNNRPFSTISIYTKSYDVERDLLNVWSWTQPTHGSVTHNGDGSFTYTPAENYLGNDQFHVTVEDGKGGFHSANLKVTLMSEPSGGGGVPVTQFTDLAPIAAGGINLSFNGLRVPRVLDWNQDGLPDLLVGAGGSVWVFTNVGTATIPAFAPRVRVQAGGVAITSGDGDSPITLADMNGDGVLDLVLCDSSRKLRVYRNTVPSNATPSYAAAFLVKNANGTDFICPDRRFDLGDWNGDGKPDLVSGTFSGNMQLFLNTGTSSNPRFSVATNLLSDSYQLYPRLFDLNGNGSVDFLRGINWGDVRYWRDTGSRGLTTSITLGITGINGAAVDLHNLTDGAVVDFGDFNGDGVPDLVVGGQGGGTSVLLARGIQKTIAESLSEIEAIYDANPSSPGSTLSANSNALLNVVNAANGILISALQNGTLGMRETLYQALTNHIAKYSFLQYRNLNTNLFHHIPSIALQNWVMLASALADTPTRRTNIADVMGLSGTMRTIFLESGLALGDNAKSIPAAYGTIRDFRRRHPRELFPDAVITIDQLYGDGRGGFLWTPNSTKNIFGDWAVGSVNEYASDLTTAIERVLGKGAASGDYFTFVAGHEVTHSLDGYVNSRPNTDLRKRWGLMLCAAAGPDIIPGTDGWWDWPATKANFRAKGYWNGLDATWNAAWSNYWSIGPGAPYRNTSFMRGSIDWFMGASQESLATQGNQHWANALGRLVGAAERFRRAGQPGLGPLRANINEVVTFIDFESAGMNRVNLVETKYQSSPKQVKWIDHYADLERDDHGYIQRITVEGQTYRFQLNTNGVVTNLAASVWTTAAPNLRVDPVGSGVQLQLTGTPGQPYRIEYLLALTPTEPWRILTDALALADSPFTLSRPATNAQEFYRAKAWP